jgi:Family of unknown function (DUF5686)/CarboxypepD_reg-like domain
MRSVLIYRFIIALLGLFISIASAGQTQKPSRNELSGRVLDGENEQPIAFAVILQQGTDNGVFTDIDGNFLLPVDLDTGLVIIQCLGYQSLELPIKKVQGNLLLYPDHIALTEVVIRPGKNPAERIIQASIDHKDINNPEISSSFRYESYNKLMFGAQLDSTLINHPDILLKKDSSTIEMYNFLEQQYIFLMETVSQRKYMPPNRSEETIIANRVSGLKNTDFFVLATQLQSFSFYGEEVQLMSKRYLSPLANNSISKYLFILENTSIIQKDTIWTISFRPRKNKNFDGMEGVLYINSKSYALQQVIASPKGNTAQLIKIQQQYKLIDNKQWFPVQLNSILIFNDMMVNNTPLVGDGKSYITNIELSPELDVNEFSPIVLKMAEGASAANDSIWSKHRPDSVSIKEINTYRVVDSLGKVINLDKKVKLLTSLLEGKLKWGLIDIDLNRLIGYNKFEGFRAGFGAHTNSSLLEWASIGGFYAYGFRDSGHKYGADLNFHLHRSRGIDLKFAYSNDVMESGGNQLEKMERSLIKSTYPLFISRMDRRELQEVSLAGRWWANLSGTAGINHQKIHAFDGYSWIRSSSDNITWIQDEFEIIEAHLTMRFALGEKLIRLGQKEVAIGGKWPVISARYSQSLDQWKWSGLSYQRIDLMLNKAFYLLNVGELSIQCISGKIIGDRPIPLLYNARGTYDKFTIAVNNTFETMRPNEFMHDEFVAIHIRHNFKHLLFRRPNFEPQLVISQSSLYGQLEKPKDHSVSTKSANHGFHETGISLTGLMKSSFSNLGLGVFYRYGPYHLEKGSSNFAFKITSTFSF